MDGMISFLLRKTGPSKSIGVLETPIYSLPPSLMEPSAFIPLIRQMGPQKRHLSLRSLKEQTFSMPQGFLVTDALLCRSSNPPSGSVDLLRALSVMAGSSPPFPTFLLPRERTKAALCTSGRWFQSRRSWNAPTNFTLPSTTGRYTPLLRRRSKKLNLTEGKLVLAGRRC